MKFFPDVDSRYVFLGSKTPMLKALVEKGIVESEPDGYFIGDPFFARYVRN